MVSKQQLSTSEKLQFAQWAVSVLVDSYKAHNEFVLVGFLPKKVMDDLDVQAIGVSGNNIEVSDYLLRHGHRQNKKGRNANLSMQALANLPDNLENATWMFDPQHQNINAFFPIGDAENVGMAAIQFKYVRKGKLHNAVVTTGIVKNSNVKDGGKREI